MKSFGLVDTLSQLCKSSKKYGMFISFIYSEEIEEYYLELFEAAPYLRDDDINSSILGDEFGYFLFENEDEMNKYYLQTKGDSPNKKNKYNGKVKVYAITCDPTGQLLNSNT